MNDRTAVKKLFWQMVANFAPSDYVVTLTYSDATLPATADLARKRFIKKFVANLRADLRAVGSELKYMYVTEGLHGDKRLHHHILLPRTSNMEELVRKNWTAGYVGFETISSRGYDVWSGYLTKEPRKTGRLRVGQRMWTPSMHLAKPTITSYDVGDDFRFEPPPGSVILDRIDRQNEWFSGQYLSYYKPEYLQES